MNEDEELLNQEEVFQPSMVRKRSNSFAGMGMVKGLEKNREQTALNRSGSNGDISPRKASNATSLRDQLKATLNKGADISDIDKIFEHVLNESKRVNESLKQVTQQESEIDPK